MRNLKKAIFAGGCFWCMVKPFDSYDGVKSVVVGYTGGNVANPTYEQVCRTETGHYEAVEITYDEDIVKYIELVEAFFMSIDPTDEGGQFNDRGRSYETAIFYMDDEQKKVAEEYKLKLNESGIFDKPIAVKILKAKEFYPAEEYHQDYLEKNPDGYCHIPRKEIELFSKLTIDPGDYIKPATETIRDRLTDEQYRITQENGTEEPFKNKFWDQFEKGIYVDIVTGEPLFSSTDKFESGCGWPAFSKPIEDPVVVTKEDRSHGMQRTEVRSRSGNSHLGHVFTNDPESPNGVRYCINSASLRFVPYAKMKAEGYGYLLYLFD